MDLLRKYSNQGHLVDHLRSLLALPLFDRPEPVRRQKQVQRRLTPEQVDELVMAYRAGAGVKQLARRFGVHYHTVSLHLERHGVTRRPVGLAPDEVPQVVALYEDGWSLARLADKFGVAAGTVSTALRKAGVAIRPRRGWSR